MRAFSLLMLTMLLKILSSILFCSIVLFCTIPVNKRQFRASLLTPREYLKACSAYARVIFDSALGLSLRHTVGLYVVHS